MDPCLLTVVVLNARIAPSLSSFIPSGTLREVMLVTQGTVCGPVPVGFVTLTVLFRDTSGASPRPSSAIPFSLTSNTPGGFRSSL